MRFHRDDFFSGYRAAFGPMQQLQVDGLNSLLDNIEEDSEWQSIPQVAYFLATIKHETGVTVNKVLQTFQPIKELREKSTSPRRANQDRYWLTGFYGRGYCQITWKENYQKFAVATGVDLVAEPDRALEPEIAYLIASTGMRQGLFTDFALSDFVNGEIDYRNARKVVNGLDKADLIASYARKFQRILEASEIGDEQPTRHHAVIKPRPAAVAEPTEPKVTENEPVVVTKEEPKPTDPKEQASISGLKSYWAALSGFGVSSAAGVITFLKGVPPYIYLGFFTGSVLVACAYFVSRNWLRNKENERLKQIQLERERMAHEITILKMKSAMDKNSLTVEVSHEGR